MALSKSFRVFVFMLAATVTLASCAKKDSDFKGRKNSAGAALVGDPNKNTRADNTSNQLGIVPPDIMNIANPVMNQQGGLTIVSRIGLGQRVFSVTLNHYPDNRPATVNTMVDNYQLFVEGRCVNTTCSPYYLNVMTRQGNQNIKQIVMKKFFFYEGESTQMDYALARDGNEFETFENAIRILDTAVLDTQEE